MPLSTKKCLRALFIFLLLGATPLFAQHEEHHESDRRSYEITETGTVSHLGVQIAVKPLVGHTGISGFQVGLSYKDPFYDDSPTANFLNPRFFHTSCAVSRQNRELGTYTHSNDRKVRFNVRLVQGCKETPGGLLVPFLEISIRCSDVVKEIRYLKAREDGRFFEIFPTGDWHEVQTNTGKALEVAQDLYEIYDTISTILVLLDWVAGTHGGLTAGEFVLKMVKGTVKGIAVDALFEYGQSQYGMRPEFSHTGWTIFCRLCGKRFHRHSLSDGEMLRCTNTQCKARARLRFH